MSVISLLVTLLILCVIGSIIYYIIQLVVPVPFRNIALALFGLIIVVYLLGILFGGMPLPLRL